MNSVIFAIDLCTRERQTNIQDKLFSSKSSVNKCRQKKTSYILMISIALSTVCVTWHTDSLIENTGRISWPKTLLILSLIFALAFRRFVSKDNIFV